MRMTLTDGLMHSAEEQEPFCFPLTYPIQLHSLLNQSPVQLGTLRTHEWRYTPIGMREASVSRPTAVNQEIRYVFIG
jgi:hypothetical protein